MLTILVYHFRKTIGTYFVIYVVKRGARYPIEYVFIIMISLNPYHAYMSAFTTVVYFSFELPFYTFNMANIRQKLIWRGLF